MVAPGGSLFFVADTLYPGAKLFKWGNRFFFIKKALPRGYDSEIRAPSYGEGEHYPGATPPTIFGKFIPFAFVQEHRVLRVFPLGDRFGEAARELRKMVLDTFFCFELLLQPETSTIQNS